MKTKLLGIAASVGLAALAIGCGKDRIQDITPERIAVGALNANINEKKPNFSFPYGFPETNPCHNEGFYVGYPTASGEYVSLHSAADPRNFNPKFYIDSICIGSRWALPGIQETYTCRFPSIGEPEDHALLYAAGEAWKKTMEYLDADHKLHGVFPF